MRELTGHKVNGCNDALKITVLDEPGAGGASHMYLISGGKYINCAVEFQNGPIAEVGTNGVTHEALLAIVIDRLESFQAGPYKCDENEVALEYLTIAQNALKSRTLARLARGVEGTHTV